MNAVATTVRHFLVAVAIVLTILAVGVSGVALGIDHPRGAESYPGTVEEFPEILPAPSPQNAPVPAR
jgi:hypothetical protein